MLSLCALFFTTTLTTACGGDEDAKKTKTVKKAKNAKKAKAGKRGEKAGKKIPSKGPGEVEDPVYSGDWTRPSRALLEQNPLPLDEDDLFLVLETIGGQLKLDPTIKDAVTAGEGCAALILACVDLGVRNFAGCFDNVNWCRTSTPWTEDTLCCAPECGDRYRALRVAGANEAEAATDAIWGADGCMPGLDRDEAAR
jgi:hypothetical protein